MYDAKNHHDGYRHYNPVNDMHDRDRLQTIEQLRDAIAREELVLHYQPKIDLKTGATVGVEALVRWEHPERGLLAPLHFLPLAEQTGLMQPLTQWVIRRALSQAQAWRDAGRDIVVAVNVSATNLLDASLPTDIATLLAQHQLPARNLQIEITESTIMTEPARAQQVVATLDQLGVRVAIDD